MSSVSAVPIGSLTALAAVTPNRPARLLVDLWNWCNFECIHCCQNSGPHESRHTWTPESLTAAIEEAAAVGVPKVTFIGGEPSLYPELLVFIRLAAANGLRVGMVSNGWCIDDAYAESLAAAGCSEVALSVYGHTAAVHEAVTRRAGSFARLSVAASALRRAGVARRVIFVVTKLSVLAMRSMECWRFIGGLDPASVRIVNFQSAGRGEQFHTSLETAPEDYVDTLGTLQSWTFPFDVAMSRFYYRAGESTVKFSCADELGSSPAIMSDGTIRPCCTLSSDPNALWTAHDLELQAGSSLCRHLQSTSSQWEVRCPLVEVEMCRGTSLIAPEDASAE